MSEDTGPMIPAIKLGSVLLTLLEPAPGQAQAFNRWYERDHFYAGCMIGANFFSGRRWIATRPLKALRFPKNNPITPDINKGSFLASYWILEGQYSAALKWSIAQVQQLNRQGRMEMPRENISSNFYQYNWGVFRDDIKVPVELALDHPFQGIAITMIEQTSNCSVDDSYHQLLRATQENTNCAMTLCLQPLPLPDTVPAYVPRTPAATLSKRSVFLHFFDADPLHTWPDFIEHLSSALVNDTQSTIIYAAPFIPTIPGTDIHVNDI